MQASEPSPRAQRVQSAFSLQLSLLAGLFTLVPLLSFAGLMLLLGRPVGPVLWGLAVVAALALVAGLALARRVSRRFTLHLQEVGEAIARVARDDFGVRERLRGPDGPGSLGGAIHSFIRDLAIRSAARSQMLRLDEIALQGAELADMMRIALQATRGIAQCDLALACVLDPAAPDSIRVYVLLKGDPEPVGVSLLPAGPYVRHRLLAAQAGVPMAQCPLPDAFLHLLQADHGVQHFLAVPIVPDTGTWGALIAAGRRPFQLDGEQLQLLSSFSIRLVAGHRAAERERRLLEFSRIDPGTGLPNLSALTAEMGARIPELERNSSLAALLRIRIGSLAQARQQMGAVLAEPLERQVVHRIRSLLHEDALLAAIGPGEFALWLPELAWPSSAGAIASRVVQVLAHPIAARSQPVRPEAHVGIALHPSDGSSAEELLHNAAVATDRAAGRASSSFAYFSDPVEPGTPGSDFSGHEILAGLEGGRFTLVYQPQFDLRTGRPCAVEALLRWNHPVRGLLAPGEFLGEQLDPVCALALARWTLHTACRTRARWVGQGLHIPRISVNLARDQFLAPGFPDALQQIVEDTRTPLGALELEIREDTIVQGGDLACSILADAAQAGIRLAIDDFGSSPTPLGSLASLPVRAIKIDLAAWSEPTDEEQAVKVLTALVRLAHALGKEVVAEGVERSQQLRLVQQVECDRAQGFLLGGVVDEERVASLFPRSVADPAQQIDFSAGAQDGGIELAA